MSTQLSDEEAAVYDRQIRVWGLDAQNRMRDSKILIVGVAGLGSEIAKNLILAGIGALTILDSRIVEPSDLTASFFVSLDDLGKNVAEASAARFQALNPRVTLTVDTQHIDQKPDSFFHTFNVVILVDCSLRQQLRVNAACRSAGRQIAFISANMHGFFAFGFEDWNLHKFVFTKPAAAESKDGAADDSRPEVMVSQQTQFLSLPEVLAVNWSVVLKTAGRLLAQSASLYFAAQVLWTLMDEQPNQPLSLPALQKVRARLCQQHGVGEDKVSDDVLSALASSLNLRLAPVCAVFGGLIAQEALKAVSAKGQPWKNVLVYNAHEASAVVLDVRRPLPNEVAPPDSSKPVAIESLE